MCERTPAAAMRLARGGVQEKGLAWQVRWKFRLGSGKKGEGRAMPWSQKLERPRLNARDQTQPRRHKLKLSVKALGFRC
eukprot:255604-Chlamydomonas_euryale.AAC.1